MAFLDNIAVRPYLVEAVDWGADLFWQRQGGHLQILDRESESARKGQMTAAR